MGNEYDDGLEQFLKEWKEKIADEYRKEGITIKDGRYYENGKEIAIIDDRDPYFEWAKIWAKKQTA